MNERLSVCHRPSGECYNFPPLASHAAASQWINSRSFSHELSGEMCSAAAAE